VVTVAAVVEAGLAVAREDLAAAGPERSAVVVSADFPGPASGPDSRAAAHFPEINLHEDPDRQCCVLPALRARSRVSTRHQEFSYHADWARVAMAGVLVSQLPASIAIW
jgi:hypothetical protein